MRDLIREKLYLICQATQLILRTEMCLLEAKPFKRREMRREVYTREKVYHVGSHLVTLICVHCAQQMPVQVHRDAPHYNVPYEVYISYV